MSNDDDDDMPSLPIADQQEPEPASPVLPPVAHVPDLMSEAMDSVGDGATALAKIAARYGLKEDDPAWLVAVAVRDATAAGVVAEKAAGRIEDATRDVSKTIYDQTLAAGKETAATLKGEGTRISQAIVKAVTVTGQAVGAELQQAALAAKPFVLRDWRAALVEAAAAEAKRRNSLAAASTWASVTFACIFFAITGAALVHEYEVAEAHLLPPGYSLIYKPNGQPACGTIPKYGEVCGVRY
ncbi:MAG: hypothetical protein ACYCXX_10135 [Acidiferrobacter thiooxydans]